jgi:hypothetical protein
MRAKVVQDGKLVCEVDVEIHDVAVSRGHKSRFTAIPVRGTGVEPLTLKGRVQFVARPGGDYVATLQRVHLATPELDIAFEGELTPD